MTAVSMTDGSACAGGLAATPSLACVVQRLCMRVCWCNAIWHAAKSQLESTGPLAAAISSAWNQTGTQQHCNAGRVTAGVSCVLVHGMTPAEQHAKQKIGRSWLQLTFAWAACDQNCMHTVQ